MDEGITEEIQALGHRYQIQTEVVGEAPRKLRTSVFDSGRIVAVREGDLDAGRSVAEALEEHHRRVVAGILERTEDGEDAGDEEDEATRPGFLAPGRSRESAPGAASGGEASAMPPVPDEPALVDGLRVRQLYGDLRRRLAGISAGEEHRLAAAEETLRWIVAHPLFPRIRLDEQLRFHRLLDRLSAEPDPGDGSELEARWQEVADFGAYLNQINHRSDLLAFDRELLEWLDRSVEARGIDPSTLTPMRWIFGRDDALDTLLEEVGTTDRAVWLDEIRRVRVTISG